jgi:phage terminase small subunit
LQVDKLALVPQDTFAAAEPEVDEGDGSSFTPRQQRFVGEYIKDLNATQAAIRAGYSARSANELGTRLLAKPHVRAAVEAAKRQRADRVKVQADDVVRELMLLATADVSQAFDEQGRLKPLKDIPEQVRRSICVLEAKIESGGARGTAGGAKAYSGQVATLRWDKMRAIELLGKHLRLFNEGPEPSGDTEGENMSEEEIDARIRAIVDRAAERERAGGGDAAPLDASD